MKIGSWSPKIGYAAVIVSAMIGVAVGYLLKGSQSGNGVAASGSGSTSLRDSRAAAADGESSVITALNERASRPAGGASSGGIAGSVDEFRQILTGDKSIPSRARFFQMLMEMTPESAPELAKVFRESGPSRMQLDAEHQLFWQRWGELDGMTACAAIFENDARLNDSVLSNTAISAWAEKSPAGARAWLLSQEDIPLRDGMMRGLVEGMAKTDIAAVQRFIDEVDLSDKQEAHAHWRIARHHLENGGVDAVGEWFSRFGDDDPMIEHVSLTAVDIYTAGSVSESLSWAQQLDRGEARTAALGRHVRR